MQHASSSPSDANETISSLLLSIESNGRIRLPKEFVTAYHIGDGMRFDIDEFRSPVALYFYFRRDFDQTATPVWFSSAGDAYVLGVDEIFAEYNLNIADYIGAYRYIIAGDESVGFNSATKLFRITLAKRKPTPTATTPLITGGELLLDARRATAYAAGLQDSIQDSDSLADRTLCQLDQLGIDAWQLDERLRAFAAQDQSARSVLPDVDSATLTEHWQQLLKRLSNVSARWFSDAPRPDPADVLPDVDALLADLTQVEQQLDPFADQADTAVADSPPVVARAVPRQRTAHTDEQDALIYRRVTEVRREGASVHLAAVTVAEQLDLTPSVVQDRYYHVRRRQ